MRNKITKADDKILNTQVVVTALQKEARPLTTRLAKVTKVITAQDYTAARNNLKALKEIAKRAKGKEDELTGPLEKVIAGIKALFAPFHQQVKDTENATKELLKDYADRQAQLAAKATEDLQTGKIKSVETYARKVAAASVPKGSGVRKVWTLRIVDIDAIPRSYLMPDEGKIKEALKGGIKVKGCVWEQVNSIAV